MKKTVGFLLMFMGLGLLIGCDSLKEAPTVTRVYLSEVEDETTSYFGREELSELASLDFSDFEHDINPPEATRDYDLYTNDEKLLLNIELENPDDLPITRITVNGVNYFIGDFYQRTGGLISTEMTFDRDEDYFEYELEEILYLDDEPITFDENPVLNVTRPINQDPETFNLTRFESSLIKSTQAQLDYEIDIPSFMIEEGLVVLEFLYMNETEKIQSKTIEPSSDPVIFDELDPESVYDFALVMYVDTLDGSGFQAYPFNEQGVIRLQTDELVKLDIEALDHHEVQISAEDDGLNEVTLDTFELYFNDQRMAFKNAETLVTFDDLWSGSEYTGVLTFEYIDHNGETVEAMKEIEFKMDSYTPPDVDYTNASMGYHTLSFTPEFIDMDSVGNFETLRVELEGETVHTQDTLDVVNLDDLLAGRSYDIVMDYTYDLTNGKGVQDGNKTVTIDTLSYTKPEIELTVEDRAYHALMFDVALMDEDDIGEVKHIEVYHEEVLIDTLDDQSLTISDLLANTAYEVRVHYTYDRLDGHGPTDDFETFEVRTESYAEPDINIENTEPDKEGFKTEILIDDPDNIATLNSINVLKGEDVIETFEGLSIDMTGLISDTSYTIEVLYLVDRLDGKGPQEMSKTFELKTEALEAPVVEISEPQITSDSALIDYDLHDPDDTVITKEYTLYKAGEEVETILNFETIDLIDLISLQEYELMIRFTYDLNDGDTTHEEIKEITFKTPPYLKVMSIEEASEPYYELGDTVEITFSVDNPNDIILERIYYNQSDSASLTNINEDTYQFSFTVRESHSGGENLVNLNTIKASFEGEDYTIGIQENHQFAFSKFESLEVNELRILDLQKSPLYYGTRSDDIVLEIILNDNPLGFDVTEVELYLSYFGKREISEEAITMSDDKTRIYVSGLNIGGKNTQRIDLKSLNYEKDTINFTDTYEGQFTSAAIIDNGDLIDISTPEDLMNMENNKGYRLVNDINLSGIDWEPKQYHGLYFDGNGYMIEDMTIEKTYHSDFDSDWIYLGLFGRLNHGAINNLVIENFSINATIDPDDNQKNIGLWVGGVAGSIGDVMIVNSKAIDGTVVLNNHSYQSVFAGGLIGNSSSFYGSIKDSSADADIDVRTSLHYPMAGGLAGKMHGNIYRSYSEGSVSTSTGGTIGGFVGSVGDIIIRDVYTSSTVEAENSIIAGGLIGDAHNAIIHNAYSDNLMKGNLEDPELYNRIIGLTDEGSYNYVFTRSTHEDNNEIGLYLGNDNEYLHVYDANDETQSLAEILEIMEQQWSNELWDFDHDLPKF